MTDMSSHPYAGRPLDVSGEGYYVLQRGKSHSFRQSLKHRKKTATLNSVSTGLQNGAAKHPLLAVAGSVALGVLAAPYLFQPTHTVSQSPAPTKPKLKPQAKAAAVKPVVKIAYHSVSISAQPTTADKRNFLNSIDRIMSNKELMQDILNISAVNGSDPMDIMLTIAFETNGDAKHFNHTVYHQNGKKVQHSARGPFQDMPDQFVSLVHNDGFAYAKKLRVYAATLSDQNSQIFMMERAQDLETLSAYLRNKHYNHYKDLVAHDPIAKRMLNKTNFSFSGNILVDMLLQDASNVKDVRDLNAHTEAKFNMTLEQAQTLIGKHIEEHLVNFLGPHMAAKITDLRAEGKGNLPMFPFVFPKKYMAEQNGAYCERTKTTTVRITKMVAVHVLPAHATTAKHAHAIHKATHVVGGTHHAKATPKHISHKPVAKGAHLHKTPVAHAHTVHAKPHTTATHKHAAAHPKHVVAVHHTHHTAPTHTTHKTHAKPTHASHAKISHAHQVAVPTSHSAHHAHAVTSRAAHQPAKTVAAHKKSATKPQFRSVTKTHIEKSCAVQMSIQDYYNKQMTRYENMFPDLNHKVQADVALDPTLAGQFAAAREHRALFLAALDGRITLPKLALPTQALAHAQPATPHANPSVSTGWYQAATQVAYNWFNIKPAQPSGKNDKSFFASFLPAG